jgi:hypothetical protein
MLRNKQPESQPLGILNTRIRIFKPFGGNQLSWGPGRPYKTKKEFMEAAETLKSQFNISDREAWRIARERRVETLDVIDILEMLEGEDLEISEEKPQEDWRKIPLFEALSHRRGRKPYFLNKDGVFKDKVIRDVVTHWKNGIRNIASICSAVYHNPNFKHFNWSKKCWEPLKLRAKTVLKWLYLYGLVKPGIPLFQKVFRNKGTIPTFMGIKREESREKGVYEKQEGWLRFQAIAMDVLGMSYEDAAVYWCQLNT